MHSLKGKELSIEIKSDYLPFDHYIAQKINFSLKAGIYHMIMDLFDFLCSLNVIKLLIVKFDSILFHFKMFEIHKMYAVNECFVEVIS